MASSRLSGRAAAAVGVTLLLGFAGSAAADHRARSPLDSKADVSPNAVDVTQDDVGPFDDHQHGGTAGHLPPTAQNVELVGKLELTGPFGSILPEQIADLSVFGRTAYLNSWADPDCARGGVFVVDIKRPRRPRELSFIPALPGNFHGEGAHVIEADTDDFEGDLLAVNNEICTDEVARGGGFDLYDVSNPRRPEVLVQGFGDFGPEASLTGDEVVANTYHSVFRLAGRRSRAPCGR